MELTQIYKPIKRELKMAEEILETSLKGVRNQSLLKISNYLLKSRGKRLRPALVILSAKATLGQETTGINYQLAKIASAIELIHLASLIYDDVLDHANLRHSKPTINSKWGRDVSLALGGYLYAEVFQIIADCDNIDVMRCVSQVSKTMCEGELLQVCERDDLDLLKEHYLVIIKKKTASLFAASCQLGAMLSHPSLVLQQALKRYGLNFGIAFQIMDDCLDIIGHQKDLGKLPGADLRMGELTLPMLHLLFESQDRHKTTSLIMQSSKEEGFRRLRKDFLDSKAFFKTKEDISFYIRKAKANLVEVQSSCFKDSLSILADYVEKRIGV